MHHGPHAWPSQVQMKNRPQVTHWTSRGRFGDQLTDTNRVPRTSRISLWYVSIVNEFGRWLFAVFLYYCDTFIDQLKPTLNRHNNQLFQDITTLHFPQFYLCLFFFKYLICFSSCGPIWSHFFDDGCVFYEKNLFYLVVLMFAFLQHQPFTFLRLSKCFQHTRAFF